MPDSTPQKVHGTRLAGLVALSSLMTCQPGVEAKTKVPAGMSSVANKPIPRPGISRDSIIAEAVKTCVSP
jgi:hypothetical protein